VIKMRCGAFPMIQPGDRGEDDNGILVH